MNQECNHREEIMIDISKPYFLQLELLDLGIELIKTEENKISSIEQLQFMNMPLLKVLRLCKKLIN